MHLFRRSLRVRVSLGILLPLVIILGTITAIEYTRFHRTLLDNLSVLSSHSGQVIETSLVRAMQQSDFGEVQSLLDTMDAEYDFQTILFLNTSGEIRFAPLGLGVGTRLDYVSDECEPCHRMIADQRPTSVIVEDASGVRVFRSMRAIENTEDCTQCHDPQSRLLGLLMIDIPVAPVEMTLIDNQRVRLLWGIISILSTLLIVNLVLSKLVVSRLEQFATTMRHFGEDQKIPSIIEILPDEIGQLATTFDRMIRQIQARSQENRQLSENLKRQNVVRGELLKRLITVQEDERQRVARELHDELGQTLSGLSFQIEALHRFVDSDPSRAHSHLKLIQTQISEATGQMYKIILDLRPSALDDLGLEAAVSWYAKHLLSGTGTSFRLETAGLNTRLPTALETTLYRVFQEALTNVVRHAGASSAIITLTRHDRLVEATITDDGCGFDVASVSRNGHGPRGLGILGMRERVALCCGEMQVESQPGKGTHIALKFPLPEGAEDHE